MANFVYDLGRKAFVEASINFPSDTIRATMVRTVSGPGAGGNGVYTAVQSTDQYFNIIPSNAYCQPVTAQALASKTDTAGLLNAASTTFTSVPTGDPIGAIIVYKDTGTASTSPLICYIDGKVTVTCATNAAAHATSIQVDPLLGPLASGVSFTFGTSGVTVTLNANASRGARTISVNDIGATGVNAGDSGPCTAQGANLPITPNGGNLTINWDNTYGVVKL